jgi:Xaa-Pro aminopeptidase
MLEHSTLKGNPMLDQTQIEKTKPDFSTEGMLFAREKTQEAIQLIASQIFPGMLEEEAQTLARDTLAELGTTKLWHRSWIRFGENTLKHYGLPSTPNVRLKENDIFFIDLGPIWNGYEGDAGMTFTRGDNTEMKDCLLAAQTIFEAVKKRWEPQDLSGGELYRFAANEALKLGFPLHLEEANGHRLGDFPHSIHYKGAMASVPFSPSRHLWVLEIQIKHPELPFGAFIEDLLI